MRKKHTNLRAKGEHVKKLCFRGKKYNKNLSLHGPFKKTFSVSFVSKYSVSSTDKELRWESIPDVKQIIGMWYEVWPTWF